jgi:hypothetical protein
VESRERASERSKRRRCCRRPKQSAGRSVVAAQHRHRACCRDGTGQHASRQWTSDAAADDTGGPAAAAVHTAEVVAAHPGVSLAPAAAAVRRCRAAFRSPVTQRDNRYAHTHTHARRRRGRKKRDTIRALIVPDAHTHVRSVGCSSRLF